MAGRIETHRALLPQAVTAERDRGYRSAFPKIPSGRIHGEKPGIELTHVNSV